MTDNLLERIKETFCGRRAGEIGSYRHFSVVVPLVMQDGEPHLLFEVRGNNIKRQPGEICFPGGECEAGEDYLEAAVRETYEELGIEREDVKILCELDSLINYSGFTIHCYLAEISEKGYRQMKLSEIEVQEVFTVPVSWLMENEPYVHTVSIEPVIDENFPYDMLNIGTGYYWRKGKMEIPIYDYKGKIIWGITGRISRNFIQILKGERK